MTAQRGSNASLPGACFLALLVLLLPGAARAQDAGSADDGVGSKLMNILRYGGTTVPPAAPAPLDDAYCPTIDIREGGAVVQVGGRGQIALGQIARECTPRPDGSVSVKLGIQGRALLGPSGSPGRFDAPVSMTIKRNGAVVASRAKQIAITIPPGSAQGSFTLVEDGLIVPAAAAKDYDIEVGLGSAPRAPRAPRARKSAPAQQG